MRKKNLEKKVHFSFGKETIPKAKVLFLRRHSNFFLTLLDMNNKVICCKTAGCHSFCSNKKRKTSFQAIECVVNLLSPFLKLYFIGSIMFVFRDLDEDICYRLIDYFQSMGIKILGLKFLMKNPHNGVRGRVLRRV